MNEILLEASRLLAQGREAQLARAKAAYVRKIEVLTESWVVGTLVSCTSMYERTYPEIDALIQARAVDLGLQFSEALGVVLRKELFGGTVPLAGSQVEAEVAP